MDAKRVRYAELIVNPHMIHVPGLKGLRENADLAFPRSNRLAPFPLAFFYVVCRANDNWLVWFAQSPEVTCFLSQTEGCWFPGRLAVNMSVVRPHCVACKDFQF